MYIGYGLLYTTYAYTPCDMRRFFLLKLIWLFMNIGYTHTNYYTYTYMHTDKGR